MKKENVQLLGIRYFVPMKRMQYQQYIFQNNKNEKNSSLLIDKLSLV